MPFLKLEDILRPTTTPEQANFLNWFYSYFNIGGKVAHRTILNVEPLFYEGLIAGTEFLVYAATKLYSCFDLEFTGQFSVAYLGSGEISLFDESNTEFFRAINFQFVYSMTNVEVVSLNNVNVHNHYFSRIDPGIVATYIKFNGYRITLN